MFRTEEAAINYSVLQKKNTSSNHTGKREHRKGAGKQGKVVKEMKDDYTSAAKIIYNKAADIFMYMCQHPVIPLNQTKAESLLLFQFLPKMH